MLCPGRGGCRSSTALLNPLRPGEVKAAMQIAQIGTLMPMISTRKGA